MVTKKRTYYCACQFVICILLGTLFPSLLQAHSKGRRFSYTIDRPHFICHISYTITGKNYIKIKRVTNGEVDYLILQDLKESHAAQAHHLVAFHPEWFDKFLSEFSPNYSNLARTKKTIQKNRGHKFGIFHQAHPEDAPRLIGIVGYHSEGIYDEKKKSVDGMYALGHPDYIQVKGAGLISIQALFNLLIYKNVAGVVVLVVHENNLRSLNIARKLQMKETRKTNKHHYWPYAEKQDEVYVFHLSAKEWKALHWRKT